MLKKGATPSAGEWEARGGRRGAAGARSDRRYDVGYSRTRWRMLLHAALVALPFVLGVLIPVLLLSLLYWQS